MKNENIFSKQDTKELIDIITGEETKTDIERFRNLFDFVGINYSEIADSLCGMLRLKEFNGRYYIFEFDSEGKFIRSY
jgi:hypothetical protein